LFNGRISRGEELYEKIEEYESKAILTFTKLIDYTKDLTKFITD